ncbi:MAG: cupin domain-containing protein, partial [Chloroflexi bacterium]|nr:cupin domain-containing protein [Chloroflexota bacterium]
MRYAFPRFSPAIHLLQIFQRGKELMAQIHHRKLPEYSALLCGHTPPNEIGFKSDQLQIWYNNQDKSWVGKGEQPHMHSLSDECFIVLRGSLNVEVDGEQFTVGEREFC